MGAKLVRILTSFAWQAKLISALPQTCFIFLPLAGGKHITASLLSCILNPLAPELFF